MVTSQETEHPTFIILPSPKLKVDGWGINCMTDDGDGILYICNYGKGLCIYNTSTGETRQYSMYDTGGKGALCNDWIKALLIDSHGLLWIATVDGLSVRRYGWLLQGTDPFSPLHG